MTNLKTKINNLTELHSEKAILRAQMQLVEEDLKLHYDSLKEKVQPIVGIFGTINKVKGMFSKDNDEDEEIDGQKSILGTALKVAVPVVVGGLIIGRGKKLLLRSLFGYGLGQATKYITSKNIHEHVSNVKSVFSPSSSGTNDSNKGIF